VKHVALMLCASAAISLAGCKTYGNDEGARYLQRKDSVTLSAGDAPRVNAVAQTLHPWPPGVGDRRIPMQGTRAVRAMECYRQAAGQERITGSDGRAPDQTNVAVGGGGGGSGSGGGATAGGGGGSQLKC
jgi:hypothetical protein